MEPIPYRALDRFSDWYHGWRDGLAGLPGRPAPRQPIPNPPTTPHREYLIRTGQHLFSVEHLLLQERLEPLVLRQEAADRDVAIAAKTLAECEGRLAEIRAEWGPDRLASRKLGEADLDHATVRKRRKAERDRAVARATEPVTAAGAALDRAEADAAAVRAQIEREQAAALVRVERTHEFVHRRMAAYRRQLVQVHPHGAWVNDQMGFHKPEVPGWAEPRLTEDPRPRRPKPGPLQREPRDEESRVLALGDHTTLGSAKTADHVIPGDGVLPVHVTIARTGTAFRLKVVGGGSPVYVEGVAVRSARMEPGDAFELARFRYEFTADGEGLRPSLHECDLIVHDLSAKTRKGLPRLAGMSLVQREGSVLVILGPSGAGKSSLFSALMGELEVDTHGRAYFKGHRLGPHTDQIRDMLGFVPQHDDLHRSLTVRRALDYAYRLRRGGRGNRAERAARIARTCEDVGLEGQIDQLVATLSGGQRRRVSIAVDMISEPDLLLLDEPTSGLDPGMDRDIMAKLRAYAAPEDGGVGRTVIVVTHATEHLAEEDTILVVAKGGRPVYCGPPGRPLFEAMQVDSYADLMELLDEDAADLAEDYRNGPRAAEAAREAALADQQTSPPKHPMIVRYWRFVAFCKQLPVLLQRQMALVMTRGLSRNPRDHFWERGKAAFVALLPLVIAAIGAVLAAAVSGDVGLGDPGGDVRNREAPVALNLLVTLCVLGGQALTYNDLVADFPIIKREYRTGTRIGAVALSKWLVFALVATLQAFTAAGVYVLFRPGPDHANVLGGFSELALDLVMTSIAAMTLGLMASALSSKTEQAVSISTGAAIAQVALNGATVDITGNEVLNFLSGFLPARWGMAAAASSTHLEDITRVRDDTLWSAGTGQWALNLMMLAAITIVCFAVTVNRLRSRLTSTQ